MTHGYGIHRRAMTTVFFNARALVLGRRNRQATREARFVPPRSHARYRGAKESFSNQSTHTDVCDAALPGFLVEKGDGRSERIHLS